MYTGSVGQFPLFFFAFLLLNSKNSDLYSLASFEASADPEDFAASLVAPAHLFCLALMKAKFQVGRPPFVGIGALKDLTTKSGSTVDSKWP